MAGRVPGSGLDDHRAVSKHIVIVASKDHRLAILQGIEILGIEAAAKANRLRKHGVARLLSHEPGSAGEIVGIRGVVEMTVGERQVSYVSRRVAALGELSFQRLRHRDPFPRYAACGGEDAI